MSRWKRVAVDWESVVRGCRAVQTKMGKGAFARTTVAGILLALARNSWGQQRQAVEPVDVAGEKKEAAATSTTTAMMPQMQAAAQTQSAVETQAAGGTTAPVTRADGTPETQGAAGMDGAARATEQDGKAYTVTGLKIDYKNAQPQQPAISELMNTQVKLGVVADGYVAARAGVPSVMVKLGDVGKNGPQKIYRSGIAAIYGQIVRFYNARSIIGVFVVVDANDIDASDADIRPADRTTLQLIVVTSSVKQVRTVAIGEAANDANRVDNPRNAPIREHSPLQPASVTGSGQRMDLLKKDALDDYVLRLNRYPGRRVDVAVSGTEDPGGVTLDYLVSENRPWYVYAQASNTGTKQTNDWRERFGFVDNELTGHDDILTLDYTTAGFDASHAVIATYELPFFSFDAMRYKVYASWDEFTASDVGQNNEQFTGDEWSVGNELTLNIFQKRELFIDMVGGFRGHGVETTNVTEATHGRATFFEPYIGFRLDRATELATTSGAVTLVGYITNADAKTSIEPLGRADPTQNPTVLQFSFSQSAFLEPLLTPGAFAAGNSTLAHEIFVGMKGQYAFDNRLFPNAEDVAGGLYSVRGYPESIVAGDSVIIGTAEYRFHLPRILPIQSDPTKTPFLWDRNFRFSPQQRYGKPDWDLIFRAFFDVAEVVNSRRESFENDATLMGAGVGVEFQFRQYFNLRVDWGEALTDVKDEVKAGSNRFHISTTILY